MGERLHASNFMTADCFFSWVWTGDKGYVSEEHDLFIVDRLKEIMKVRGFQVAPAELEGHLLQHPFVSDVCVVGVPDGFSGELPFAFIVPNAEAAEVIKRGQLGVEKVKSAISKVCGGSLSLINKTDIV
jgi:4-coumarate--CoA ligase